MREPLIVATIRWGSVGSLLVTSLAIMGSPGPATISLTAAGSAYGVRRSLAYLVGIVAGTTIVLVAVAAGITAALLAVPALRVVLIGRVHPLAGVPRRDGASARRTDYVLRRTLARRRDAARRRKPEGVGCDRRGLRECARRRRRGRRRGRQARGAERDDRPDQRDLARGGRVPRSRAPRPSASPDRQHRPRRSARRRDGARGPALKLDGLMIAPSPSACMFRLGRAALFTSRRGAVSA